MTARQVNAHRGCAQAWERLLSAWQMGCKSQQGPTHATVPCSGTVGPAAGLPLPAHQPLPSPPFNSSKAQWFQSTHC